MKKVFSARLIELRGTRNTSEFARFLGMKQATLDRYVKMQRTPNGESIVQICKACGVSADWLLGLAPACASPPPPFPPSGLHAAEAPAAQRCPDCARLNAIIDAMLDQRREAAPGVGRSSPARKSSSGPVKSSLYPA